MRNDFKQSKGHVAVALGETCHFQWFNIILIIGFKKVISKTCGPGEFQRLHHAQA
jgi:hypothetical protein